MIVAVGMSRAAIRRLGVQLVKAADASNGVDGDISVDVDCADGRQLGFTNAHVEEDGPDAKPVIVVNED